jgi:hypothetical protein
MGGKAVPATEASPEASERPLGFWVEAAQSALRDALLQHERGNENGVRAYVREAIGYLEATELVARRRKANGGG